MNEYMHFCILLFFCFPILVSSQNLVPNANFDEVTTCPYDWNQVHFAEPWYNPSNGLPAIFNVCSTAERFAVPNAGVSVLSYMEPRSGNGYGYLRPYRSNFVGVISYLGVPLLATLEKGRTYYIEFYVRPDHLYSQEITRFSDAFGLAFTSDYYYEEIEPHGSLSLEPVIENRGRVIDDIQNWTKISGCYKAEGWEAHAILGNFRSTDETIFETNRPDVNGHSVFWYIEDVLIQKFDPLPDVAFLCSAEDSIHFTMDLPANDYRLNNNSVSPTFSIDASGTYVLDVFFDNCTLSDTMIVYDNDHLIREQKDTIIEKCDEVILVLDVDIPGESFIWNTGDTTKSIKVTEEGIYNIIVDNNCGELKSTYQVINENCDCPIYIPNVFTPNGDGINDKLEVFTSCDFPIIFKAIKIYDRWGNLMFKSEQVLEDQWDGALRGNLVEPGPFVWYLEYEVEINGKVEKKHKSGTVKILK